MSKGQKKWMIAAAFLVVAGLLIFGGAFVALGFDYRKLSTQKYVTNSYELSGDFEEISIRVPTTEVIFTVSEDEKCRIECLEKEKERHYAAIQNRTLEIDTVDTRKWYDYIGINIECMKITVALPKTAYDSLSIDTDTGDVEIPEVFSFENVRISGNTADISCQAAVSDSLEIDTDTGDIEAEPVKTQNIKLNTDTGEIRLGPVNSGGAVQTASQVGRISLTDVNCRRFSAESNTGNIVLKNVVAKDSLFVESDTGNVSLEGSDAAYIAIQTDTGNVAGELLSGKIFLTETDTGNVDVPQTTSGGKCEIKSDTGDIRITVRNDVSVK